MYRYSNVDSNGNLLLIYSQKRSCSVGGRQMRTFWNLLADSLWFINLVPRRRFPRHSTRYVKQIMGYKELNVLEIGTLKAENARNILKTLNVKTLTIIDPYEEYKEYWEDESNRTQKALEKYRKIAERRLSKWHDKLIWIKKRSEDAIEDIKDNSMDFIYIDGNHTYEYALEDMRNYWNKVKDSGVLAGHDINSFGHEGVAKAFLQFCSENKLTPIIHGQDWILEKK